MAWYYGIIRSSKIIASAFHLQLKKFLAESLAIQKKSDNSGSSDENYVTILVTAVFNLYLLLVLVLLQT